MDMEMAWHEGWEGLLDAVGRFHDGVVHGVDLSSQSYVDADLRMFRQGAPADVRLIVQFQNAACPAVLIDLVDVIECGWSNDRNLDFEDPVPIDREFTRYSILEFWGVAGGLHWLQLDSRALGQNAARHRRATGG